MYYFTLIIFNRVEASTLRWLDCKIFIPLQRLKNFIHIISQLYLWTMKEFFCLYSSIFVSQQMASGYDAFFCMLCITASELIQLKFTQLYFINFMFMYSKFHLFWIQQTSDDKQHKQKEALVFFFEIVVAVVEMKSFLFIYFSMQKKIFLLFFICAEEERKEWKSI